MSGFVTVDGIKVPIEGEKNLLTLIQKAGIDIPTFCYHSHLSTYGACRLCLVEINGKEIDAILVDGELPATSSPTPIAASSAISTIKSAEDIIKPPAPEKGSRLMIALGITAGALALALMGVLIVALFTGAFR